MSSVQLDSESSTEIPSAWIVGMKLEVVVPPVSDVDRAKRFYETLGFRMDTGERRTTMDVANLAGLLREAAEHHHHYEQTSPEHDWSEWYAPYIIAREQGSTPEEASNAAALYMEDVR